jgi:nitronate monooxygenase
MQRWEGREGELERSLDAERPAFHAAAREGDLDTAMVWAGEVVDLIRSVESAAELVESIGAQAEAQLRAAGKRLSEADPD